MTEIHRRPVSSEQGIATHARASRAARRFGGPRAASSSPSRAAQQPGLWSASLRAADFALGPRCSERGCIFPATESGTGRCLLHELEEREPAHFLSCQPTLLILDLGKFGPPDPEADYSRARDRRRLATLREEFLEDIA
jgi:hypothetical protein